MRRSGRWVFVLVVLAVIGLIAYLMYRPSPHPAAVTTVGQVQSSVTQVGDSLQVIVQWRLNPLSEAGRADTLRLEVRIDSLNAIATRTHPRGRQEDTVHLPAPEPGTTVDGLSCVGAREGMASRETCTPWRFVRPAAQPSRRDAPRDAAQPMRIVVRPQGLQVDPDLDGRCAAWQRQHPSASVWIQVNRVAVPACTGPNNRPTVAQFCAFAELHNGRRIKTANSANIPYCDQLFVAWARERAS